MDRILIVSSLLEVAGNASAYAAGAVGKIGDAGEVLAAGVGHGTAAAIRGGTAYVTHEQRIATWTAARGALRWALGPSPDNILLLVKLFRER